MSIKQNAKEFLDKCRVIENNERKEGTIVKMDCNTEFQVVKVYSKKNNWFEDKIDEFSIVDIIDENDDQMVINFKEIMFEIVGKKHYFIERSVYLFLKHDDTIFDDEDNDDLSFDDAEERAAFEAAEEEEAEHNFDRFLRNQEEM